MIWKKTEEKLPRPGRSMPPIVFGNRGGEGIRPLQKREGKGVLGKTLLWKHRVSTKGSPLPERGGNAGVGYGDTPVTGCLKHVKRLGQGREGKRQGGVRTWTGKQD